MPRELTTRALLVKHAVTMLTSAQPGSLSPSLRSCIQTHTNTTNTLRCNKPRCRCFHATTGSEEGH
eukprot:11211427-Lingulodinium_polyedra.AAC.1